MNPTTEQITRAAQAARFFRDRGYNALPSRADRKGPAMAGFADYWERPLPDEDYDRWSAVNLQVMTGTHWRLCVVDCDGDEAHTTWRRMKKDLSDTLTGPWPTWVSRTGGGGWHYWFGLPEWVDACPSGRLWGVWDTYGGPRHQGDWRPHEEIRLLADRALVVAPPSLHVETGREYRWVQGRGPDDHPCPAIAPDWLLGLPRVSGPSPAWTPPAPPPARSPVRPAGAFKTREEVLLAIPDKIAVAQRWGLRFASLRANAAGWCSVHAIDREDRSPSASFSPASGVYTELRDGARLSLFDLGVALGRYSSWEECKQDLAAEFLPCVRTRARAQAQAHPRAPAPAR